MSRSELERLVAEAELRSELRQRLQGCHSREELARLARSLGFGVTTGDLERAEASDKATGNTKHEKTGINQEI
jgi:predicted ribosomally synthesized peptide with nif11-like leader